MLSKMLERKYSLRWDLYRNHLSNGFSKLQQKQEFVDVTLAAGGHLVGAHQNILALASPYLKEMLQSAPCPHPVIFLGTITHTILAFILEYIYTGEVIIPRRVLPSFIEASKMLHIEGAKDIQVPQFLLDNQDTRIENDITLQHRNVGPLTIPNEDGNLLNVQSPVDENQINAQPPIDGNQINVQPTIDRNQINVQPTIDGNQINVQPAIDGNQINVQPTIDGNQINVQPTIDGNQSNVQPAIDGNQINVLPTIDGNQICVQLPIVDEMNASQIMIDSHVPSHLSTLHIESIRPVNIQDYSTSDKNELCEQFTAMETKLPPQVQYIDGENQNTISNKKEENLGLTNFAACIKIDNESHEVSVQPLINYNIIDNEPHSDDDYENYMPVSSSNSPHDQHRTENEDFEELVENQAVADGQDDNMVIINRLDAEQDPIDENILPKALKSEKLDFQLDVQTDSGLVTISKIPDSSGSKFCDTANDAIIGKTSALYTKSSRDSILMVLNRFIYNLHHKSFNGRKCRWRCINYRHDRCPAFVDTVNEEIISRKNMHQHDFHDSKILKLGRRHALYTTLREATERTVNKVCITTLKNE